MQRLLVATVACAAACAPAQRLTANSPLEASRGDGVSARMIRLELTEGKNLDPGDLGTATVELVNGSKAPVEIHQDRMKYVGWATDPGPQNGGGIGLGLVGGSSTGSMGSSGGSSGSGPGSALGSGMGVAGVGLGIIAAGIVLVPLGLGYLIYKGITDPPDRLEPGERARYRIDVTRPVADREQHIELGIALDRGNHALAVPLIDPARPHGGWNAPKRLDELGVRMGGGPIVGDGKYSGTGGFTVLSRRRVGAVAIGAAATLLGVSMSIEPQLAVPITMHGELVEVAPVVAAEAGGTLVGRTWFLSPTAGAEVTFPVEHWDVLGWKAGGMRAGVFGKAGPVWIDSGREWRWEAGFVMR